MASSPGVWQDTKDDIRRYGGWMALWREQSAWPLLWFRLGCALQLQSGLLIRTLLAPSCHTGLMLLRVVQPPAVAKEWP